MRPQAQHTAVVPPEQSRWLQELLAAKFFAPCNAHPGAKKNEANIFCMTCFASLCHHCLGSHAGHQVLQVRRYVYHDVVRLNDVSKLVDCTGVQPYIINSARVVFLNERPQPRLAKGGHNACQTCERSLQDEYQYCSLGCKVNAAQQRAFGTSLLLKAAVRLLAADCGPSDGAAVQSMEGLEARCSGPSQDSTSLGSSSHIEPESASDDDSLWHAPYLRAPKKSRTSRVQGGSPKSVLPATPPQSFKPPMLQDFLQQYVAMATKRRKSHPQRSPAS